MIWHLTKKKSIFCWPILFICIFSCSAEEASISTNYDMLKFEVARFAAASDEKIVLVPTKQGASDSFNEFIIIAKKLDLAKFKQVNADLANSNPRLDSLESKPKYITNIDFNYQKPANKKDSLAIATVYSPLQLKCGENCFFAKENMVRLNDKYFFLSSQHDFGIEAKMINANNVLFMVNMATHVKNIMFRLKEETPVYLPDGTIEAHKKYLVVRGKKSYFPDGGAFSYDMKVDYNGKVIELLDYKNENAICIARDKFDEPIKKQLTKMGKKKFCVIQ